MRNHKSLPVVYALTILSGTLSSLGAVAQTTPAQGSGIEEIMVTAQRFASSLQTTPVAITALSETMMQQRQIANVSDLAPSVPNLVMAPAPGLSSVLRVYLRGIGQQVGGVLFDPAVGIYIDNVYQPRPGSQYFDFFDIDRIEVLRGPQGTLYGRNTSGGAIKIVTRAPSFAPKLGGDVAVGNYATVNARASVSSELIGDKLAGSLSGVLTKRGGIITDPNYSGKVNKIDTQSVRTQLLFVPDDKFEVRLSGTVIRDRTDVTIGSPIQLLPGVINPNARPDRNLLTSEIGGPRLGKMDSNLASANIKYEISPEVTINAVTGYGLMHNNTQDPINQNATGPTGLNGGNSGLSYTWRDTYFSQELNLTYNTDRIDGVAGVFYIQEHGVQLDGPPYSTPDIRDRHMHSYAGFAQATYKLPAHVNLTAGIRYTHDKIDFEQFYYTLVNFRQADAVSYNSATPKFGIDWNVREDLLLYASYTRGFKSGGFSSVSPTTNIGPLGLIGKPLPYNPERSGSFEGGTKYTTSDNRFRVNLALFRVNYSGIQLTVRVPGGAANTSYTANASAATVWGIELEPTWNPTDGLQIFGSLSTMNAKYTQPFTCAIENTTFTNCQDRPLPNVPKFKSNLGFTYELPLGLSGTTSIGGTWDHVGAYQNSTCGCNALTGTPAYDLFNASLMYELEDKHWSIAVEAKNVTNHLFRLDTTQTTNAISPSEVAFVNTPRIVTLRVRARY